MKFLLFAFYLSCELITITEHTYQANCDSKEISDRPPCNENKLIMFLADIQVINPENIIYLCINKDLKELCNKLSQSLQNIDKYLNTCKPPPRKNLYMQLIRGVYSLHKKVCIQESFQKDFQKHIKCFKDLRSDYHDCLGPPDWTEDSDDKNVCRVYQDVVNCHYVKTAILCGKCAAKLMKTLIVDVFNNILTINCDVSKIPVVKDPMPEPKAIKGCSHKIYPVYFNLFILILIHMMVL